MSVRTLLATGLLSAAMLLLGCNAANDAETTVKEPEPTRIAPLESYRADAKVSTSQRLFIDNGKLFSTSTAVTNSNGLHSEFIKEFLQRPGAGFGRMTFDFASPPRNWVELVSDSLGDVGTGQGAKGNIQYEPVTETLTLGNGDTRLMRERVWLLQSQNLMSVNAETGPAVYLNSPKNQHDLMKAKPTGATAEKRQIDAFEKEALERLRKGDDVALRSDDHELRVLGAIRARKDCLSCHKVEVGTMLGAFTYTLNLQSEETPEADKLKDKTGLSEQQVWAVRSIEGVGGKLTRNPGGSVSDAKMSYTRNQQIEANRFARPTRLELRDSALQHLLSFPELTTLDVSHSLVSDSGLKTIAELKHLKKLDLSDTRTTKEGIAMLKKSLPQCEVLIRPIVPVP